VTSVHRARGEPSLPTSVCKAGLRANRSGWRGRHVPVSAQLGPHGRPLSHI